MKMIIWFSFPRSTFGIVYPNKT